MKTKTASIAALTDQAVEPEIHADQEKVELAILATLATVINSDQADLKYELLELQPRVFHFAHHRAIFSAMKELADAGDHVDLFTVRAKTNDAWPDKLKEVFTASNPNAAAAATYKRKVIYWAKVSAARTIGNAYLAALEHADESDTDLAALVANLQRAVFNAAATDDILPPLRSEADLTDGFLLDLMSPKRGYATGFPRLDEVISGLTPGLFILAAPPSAGKTTFIKQLADNVAELNEAPVLFFSYEQSADELRVKSLARLTKREGRGISNEKIKSGTNAPEIEKAAEIYKGFGKWITVIEGDRQHTVSSIRLLAQRERMKTGKAPVIIIDYLQILPVADASLRDKRTEVDFLVTELRRIARDIQAPVIAISAMSRAQYNKLEMSGFKESGGIEYASDIAAIMKVETETPQGDKRTVSLGIIKNRNGRRAKVGLTYDMKHDSFEESMEFNDLDYLTTLGKNDE